MAAPSLITGTVFEDFNSNGTQDTAVAGQGIATDRGVGGITVNAYTTASGLTPVGTATTNADGTFAINIAPPDDGPYRIEFTGLPAGYQPSFAGPGEQTSVRFVPDGAVSGVNFGIVSAANYCQDNPQLVTTCMTYQNNLTGPFNTRANVVSFPYTAEGINGGQRTTEALANQVGTTYGVAYHRQARVVFVSAYTKRATGYGPGSGQATSDGTGTIYAITPGAPVGATPFVDLDDLFGAATTGANPHTDFDPLNGNGDFDAGAFDAVGRVGLGDLEVSEDGSALWVINLNDRALYRLPVALGPGNTPIPPTAAQVTNFVVPAPNCANGVGRPFGLKVRNGLVYVGGVCTEETSGSLDASANLQAYVYSFNPATSTFSPAPVLQFPLNYPRGCADAFSTYPFECRTGVTGILAEWRPWLTLPSISPGFPFPAGTTDGFVGHPQPILADIEFVGNDMVVGLRDRFADQVGFEDPGPLENFTPLLSAIPAGDVLRASPNGAGGWTLENNAQSVPPGAFGPSAGANNEQGPGNGEFYLGDNSTVLSDIPGQPAHDESDFGALAQVPGFPDMVSNSLAPVRTFASGMVWMNNQAGTRTRAYEVYPPLEPGSLVKANGLGDVEALCDEAPIQIGNRVWADSNNNGRQDPDEPPLPNVTVGLYDNGGTLIATTTTSANGTYYFSSTGGGPLLPNTAYQIRIDTTQPALTGLQLTTVNSAASGADVSNNPITDVRDSDANQVGNFSTIIYTTGGPGANNHGLDFGFVNIVQQVYDLGDNPDTGAGTGPGNYNTLLNDNGARHQIIPGLFMGALVDAELDGQPNVTATGDDTNPPTAPDDEDGVVVSDLTLQIGAAANVRVNATNTTGSLGTVCGYIDFNGDGDFLDAGEGVSVQVPTGSNNVQFILAFGNVPAGSAALTYARFRLAINIEACSPVGTVPSGEVEDYRVEISTQPPPVYDLGDNPDTRLGTGPGNYNTLLNNNGARHRIIPGLFMGATVDPEPDGQPNVPATGDDTNPPGAPDDEDGVIVADLTLTQTLPANVRVNATNTTGTVATLCGFMDWNGDGDFLDAGETASVTVATGSNNVQYILAFGNVPLGAAASTYARFRLSNGTETCTPVGTVESGEVEDYTVTISIIPPPEVVYDLGDNPDTGAGTGPGNYNTLLNDNGARHRIITGTTRLHMGATVDAELDGQPNVESNGDDVNPPGAPDDEDGVTVSDLGPNNLVSGNAGTVRVIATNTTGQPALLCGFIDWNADGDYGDANESASVTVPTGSSAVEFILAFGVIPARPDVETYSRFRLTLSEQMSACTWVGTVQSGEVEDYVVPRPTAITLVAFTAQQQGDGVNVSWRTGSERDSYGFFLWRSSTGQRGDAVKANADLIPAKGQNGGGAAYSFVDPNGKPGDRYWLQEQELSGALLEYGSVVATAAASSAPVVPPVVAPPAAPPAAAQPVAPQPVMPQPAAPQPIVAQVNAESQPAGNAPAPQPLAQGQPVVVAQPVAAASAPQAVAVNVEPAAAPAQPVAQAAADAVPAAVVERPVAAAAPAQSEVKVAAAPVAAAQAAAREQEVVGAKRGVGVLHGERTQSTVGAIESVAAQPQPAAAQPLAGTGIAGIGIAAIALGLIGAMGAIGIRRRKLNG